MTATSDAPAPRKGSYARNLAGQGVARLVYMGASFAAFILIARLSDATVLGHYSLVLAILNMANAAADFGSNTLVAADLTRTFAGREANYYGTFLMLRLIAGAITAPIMVAAAWWLDPAIGPAMIIVGLGLPLIGARFYDAVFQVYDRPAWTAALTTAYGIVVLVGSYAVLRSPGDTTFWLIAILALSGIAYGGLGLNATFTFLRPTFHDWPRETWTLAKRCAPIALANFVGMLNGRVGILMLSTLATPQMIGVYNAGFRFFELGVAVAVTIATPLVPVLTRAPNKQAQLAQMQQATTLGLVLALPVAALAPLLAPSVIDWIYGSKYEGAAAVAALLAIAFACNLLAMILYGCLVAVDRAGSAVLTSVAAVIVNVVVGLIAVPHFGVNGTAYAAIASEITTLTVNFILLSQTQPDVFDLKRLAPLVALGGVMIALSAVTPAALALPVGLAAFIAYAGLVIVLKFVPNPLARLKGSNP